MKTRLVVATRESGENFFRNKATGRSIAFNRLAPVEVRLFAENTRGLPAVYNMAIRESLDEDVILVFAHDDLLLLDYFWPGRIAEGLQNFGVLGLAGNTRRLPGQPGWAYLDMQFTHDSNDNLSGAVGHGPGFPPASLNIFGPPRRQVRLLDGLLLAVTSTTLRRHDLWFDERFDFHHYDLDFCRQAEQRGVTMGTWDIAVVHHSYGDFYKDSWKASAMRYLEKWPD